MGPMTCMPYEVFKNIAVNKYGNVKRGWGIMQSGRGVVEIHYNNETGTWVMVLVMPQKDHIAACPGPHGQNWTEVEPDPMGEKS